MSSTAGESANGDLERSGSLCRMARYVGRGLLPLHTQHEIVGLERIPKEGPAILASKHIYWFDSVMLACFIDRINYTFAKSEYFDTSTTWRRARRWWMKKMGAYRIGDREDGLGVRPSDVDVLLRPAQQGALVVIYPEGTRVVGRVGELKKGLAATVRLQAERNPQARLPIIPLSPAYSKKPFGSFRSYVPFRERIRIALVVGEPLYHNGEKTREFTMILKERITECYDTARNLVTSPRSRLTLADGGERPAALP